MTTSYQAAYQRKVVFYSLPSNMELSLQGMLKTTPFRFFDLPREIRDQIYELLIVDVFDLVNADMCINPPTGLLFAHGVPCPLMLRVGHKCSDEYRDRLPGVRKMTFASMNATDIDHLNDYSFISRVPDVIERCTIYVYVQCNCPSPQDWYWGWLDNPDDPDFEQCIGAHTMGRIFKALAMLTQQRPNLRSLHVKIGLSRMQQSGTLSSLMTSHTHRFEHHLNKILSMPDVELVELVSCHTNADLWSYCDETVIRWQEGTPEVKSCKGSGRHDLKTFAVWTMARGWDCIRDGLLRYDGH